MGFHKNSPKNSPRNSPRNSPKNSPRRFKSIASTLRDFFDIDSSSSGNNNASGGSSPLSGLSSPVRTRQEPEDEDILSTIAQCSLVFTFIDPSESPTQQDHKQLKLIQLLSYLKSSKQAIPEAILPPLVSMLADNLFRPLYPSFCNHFTGDFPDDEGVTSAYLPAWPHLQTVYNVLVRLVMSHDPRVLKRYIDQPFLVNLLSLFQSEDPRERDSLKNVYHRIYSRFTFHRSFMRKSMNDAFLRYVFETERHCGIAEMLEIWGSIINGFTVPLKEEHRMFLMRVLIPLHKTKGMPAYHRQLAYCVNQFVQKEPMLGGVVVRGILKYWPVTNCQKEVLLIGELEELVENIDTDQYRRLALPLCSQITRCLNSWNAPVAERALYVWNNEQFVKMAMTAMEDVYPVMVEGMERNLRCHWSKSVKQLTENVKAMLEEMDLSLYEKCQQEMLHKEFVATQEEAKRKAKWERIELEAAKNHHLLQPPQPQHNSICV